MANPVTDWVANQDGEWIIGIGSDNGIRVIIQVRLADQGETDGRDISGAVITVPSRESKIVVQGAVHNVDGTIQGRIVDFGGVTALEYLDRLHELISNQHRYRLIVVKRNLYIASARFHTRYTWTRVEGTSMWDVSIPYAEVS